MKKEHIKNLKLARNFLTNHVTDEQFHMDFFRRRNDKFGEILTLRRVLVKPECGTIGCALGWLVSEPTLHEKLITDRTKTFYEASSVLFGLQSDNAAWDFIFSSAYAKFDNTREGAIGRMDVLIKYPNLFDK